MDLVLSYLVKQKNCTTLSTDDHTFMEAVKNESFQYPALRALLANNSKLTYSVEDREVNGTNVWVRLEVNTAPEFFQYGHANSWIFKRDFLMLPDVQAYLLRNYQGIEYHLSYILRGTSKASIGEEALFQTMILISSFLEAHPEKMEGFRISVNRRVSSLQHLYECIEQNYLLSYSRVKDPKHPITNSLVDIFYENYRGFLKKNDLLTDAKKQQLSNNQARVKLFHNETKATPTDEKTLSFDSLNSLSDEPIESVFGKRWCAKVHKGLNEGADLATLARFAVSFPKNERSNKEISGTIKELKNAILKCIKARPQEFFLLDLSKQATIRTCLGYQRDRFFKNPFGTESIRELKDIVKQHRNNLRR